MNAVIKSWIAPLYLFACLILGGSSLGGWHNTLLQAAAIGIIFFACLQPGQNQVKRQERLLGWLVAGLICWIAIQLIPLPPGIWHQIPGRGIVRDGDVLIGLGSVWRPISLSPPDTWSTLPTLLPPVAMYLAVAKFSGNVEQRLVTAVAIAAALGLLLGLLQIGSAPARGDEWYLYDRSNIGVASGFFANGNHMAALLLCVLPLVAASVEHAMANMAVSQRFWSVSGVSAGLGVMVAVGLLLNGSLFGLAMFIPVFVVSLMVALRHFVGRRERLALSFGAAIFLSVGAIYGISNFDATNSPGASVSVGTRLEIASNSLELVRQHFPAGSGAGTFERVYPTVEDPGTVDRFYVNHAHDDYLEWIIEGGLVCTILLILFLAWWARASLRMFAYSRSTGYAWAGAAIGAILLAHSLVDFPLRSPGLAALFAAAVAMMLTSRRLPKRRTELRPARHVALG